MKYNLINATNDDINYIKDAKAYNIFKYGKNLSKEEIIEINNYVNESVFIELKKFKIIVYNNKKIGCLLTSKKDDDLFIDELYIEDNYRNKGIGTNIIKKIIENKSNVYLWVYKENIRAISLYKKMNFKVVEETKTRYCMKYSK